MGRLVAFALIVSATIGCSSAVTSPSTLEPGQISAGEADGVPSTDPGPVPPPTGPSMDPKAPMNGCPSMRPLREEPTTELASTQDFTDRVVGIYKTCLGTGNGIEVRFDPVTKRLEVYELDSRFVRSNMSGLTGTIDVSDCQGATCNVTWSSETLGEVEGTITMWTDPIALEVMLPAYAHSRDEWLRVAD